MARIIDLVNVRHRYDSPQLKLPQRQQKTLHKSPHSPHPALPIPSPTAHTPPEETQPKLPGLVSIKH